MGEKCTEECEESTGSNMKCEKVNVIGGPLYKSKGSKLHVYVGRKNKYW